MSTITAIFQVKTSLKDVVKEGKQKFHDKIGDEDFVQEECAFRFGNTPVKKGYVRLIIEEDIAITLESEKSKGVISDNMDLISVDRNGQTDLIVGQEDVYDTDGKKIGKQDVYLGKIAGVSEYNEPV